MPRNVLPETFEEFLANFKATVAAIEEKWAEYYPPAKWDQVTADPDHLAGLNTPYVDEEEEDFDDVYEDDDYETDEDYETSED